MAQANNLRGTLDETTVLRDVLEWVSVDPRPENSVPPILEIACMVTGAANAFFLLFNEPRILVSNSIIEDQIPDSEDFENFVHSLEPGLNTNPPVPESFSFHMPVHLMMPVRLPNAHNVGVLWLNLESDYTPTEDVQTLLDILFKGVLIATQVARAHARTYRLTRNQAEFMRIVSHDLRSPLTSMQGFASMLESKMVGGLNEKQAHFVSKILSGVSQMTSLVENIQDAGRYDLETGFYVIERTPCDVIEIVDRIVNNHLVPAEKQELTVEVVTTDDIPIINADTNMLERAITNLVDNAIKYTPNGGRIEVGIRRDQENIVIYVKDDGHGISPEDQRRLFERHTRLRRKEHKRVKGSGLGLFIVRSVAQHHGGQAWVKSAEGEGSTFFMSIPLKGANLLVSEEISPQSEG